MNQVYIFAGMHEKMCSVGAIQGLELNIGVLELKKKKSTRSAQFCLSAQEKALKTTKASET